MGLFSEVCDNNVPVTFVLLRQDIPEFRTCIITDFLPYLLSVSSMSFVSSFITLSKLVCCVC